VSGYAGSGWGIGPWGGGVITTSEGVIVVINDAVALTDEASYEIPLRVAEAFATSPFSVRVRFSNKIDITFPPFVDASNYTIPGLTVLSAAVEDDYHVLLQTTPAQQKILYTVTVGQALSSNGDALGPDDSADFLGFALISSFFAGAQSTTKVELVFSTAMEQNAAFTDPASYTITAVTGSVPIPVLSATPSGPEPIRRVTLIVGTLLESLEYYAVVLAPEIVNVLGERPVPHMDIFQWADMTRPRTGRPLEIPIKDFSGEVTDGLLGAPDGQVFFSPALEEAVSSDSTIELETLSVCTRAYDEYRIPNPPDPVVLFTFGPGVTTVTGPSTVLWGDANRLGQAIMSLKETRFSDDVQVGSDFLAAMILQEPIDSTRGGFLNDPRFVMRGGSGSTESVSGTEAELGDTATVLESLKVERLAPGFTATWDTPVPKYFTTADNLTPIGPGPSFYDISAHDLLETQESAEGSSWTFERIATLDSVSTTDSVAAEMTYGVVAEDSVIIVEALIDLT